MCTRTTHVGQRTRVHWGEPNWVCSILALHLRDVYLLGKCCMLHDILPQPDRTKRVYITLDRTHILSTTEAFHLPPGCCRRFASPGQPFPITRTCGVHRSKALWNNDLPKVTCTYCALRQPRPKAASPPSASVPVPACLATITAYIEPNRRPYALAIPA